MAPTLPGCHRRRHTPIAGATLLILAAVAYLPGFFSLPPVDRDESRFAEASREMRRAGTLEGWIVPRIQDRPRLAKPPLIYWAQAAAASLCDPQPRASTANWEEPIWMYRVPSLVAALVAVWATWRLGCSIFDPRTAWLGALLLGCSPMVLWDVRQARADEGLLAATVVSQWCLWIVWSRRHMVSKSPAAALLLWFALGIGILVKGPVTPMIVALTAATLILVTRDARWLRRLRPAIGVVLLTAIVVPWPLLLVNRIGWGPYANTLGDEIVGRSLAPKEGHWGPPGYHLLFGFLLLWPGALLLAPALMRAARRGLRPGCLSATARQSPRKGAVPFSPQRWLRRVGQVRAGRDAELFCLAWIVPSWVMFELVSTKLPHYTLPLYPPLTLLTARLATQRLPASLRRRIRLARVPWLSGGLLVFVAAPLMLWQAGRGRGAMSAALVVGLVAVTALLAAAWRALDAEQFHRMLTAASAVAVVGGALLFTLLPEVDALWLSPRVTARLRSLDPGGTRPLAAVTYHEDSLVFLTAGRVQRIQSGALRTWLQQNPGGLVILPSPAADDPLPLRTLSVVEGFNYSKGTWLRLRVAEAAADAIVPTQAPP